MASPAETEPFHNQFALARSEPAAPRGWPRRTLGGWHLAAHPALPVVPVRTNDDADVGWLIGHAIARGDAVVIDQQRGHGIDVHHHVGEAPALVLIDEEGDLPAITGGGEQLAQAGRGVLERSDGHAAHLDGLDLEPLAGCGDGGRGLFVGQHDRRV